MQEHKVRNLQDGERAKKGKQQHSEEGAPAGRVRQQRWGNRVTEKRLMGSSCPWAFLPGRKVRTKESEAPGGMIEQPCHGRPWRSRREEIVIKGRAENENTRGRGCPCPKPFPQLPSPEVRLSPWLAREKKGHCSLGPLSSPSETLCLRKGSQGRAGWGWGGDKQVAPRLTLNPDNGKGCRPAPATPVWALTGMTGALRWLTLTDSKR